MLRITVELLPQGNPLRARRLGVIEIENAGGSLHEGDYEVTVIDEAIGQPTFTYPVSKVPRGIWFKTVAWCLARLCRTKQNDSV